MLRSARNDDSQLNWLFETLNPWQFIEHERVSVLDTPLSRSMTVGIYFGCLKFESERCAVDHRVLRPRHLAQHLQHQLHRHQHRIVAARQAAFGDAAEIVDKPDVQLCFKRAACANCDHA